MDRKRKLRRILAWTLGLVVLAYAALVATFYVKQEAWLHASPRERPPGLPSSLTGREIRIPSGDRGERLAAWWLDAGEAAPAVLYLIGVGHTLADTTETVAAIRGFGASVLAVEYRGFGLSDGAAASERTLYEDGEAAWRALAELAPGAARRVIHGHSIGGAVAIELARRHPEVSALVLESTFTSMAEVLEQSRIMRALPLGLVLTQRYPSAQRIAALAMPKLLIHGADDIFVPPRMSEALFAAAREPRTLVLVPGAGHSDAFVAGAQARAAARELVTGARMPGPHARRPFGVPARSSRIGQSGR